MGVQKRTMAYSLESMTKTNYAAKIPSTVQLLKGEKTSHLAYIDISLPLNSFFLSKHVFTAVSYGGLSGACRLVICFPASNLQTRNFEFANFDFRNAKIRVSKREISSS